MRNALAIVSNPSSIAVWLFDAHLDMAYCPVRSLVEPSITNPSIYSEKRNDLVFLVVLLDREAPEDLHTDAVVDFIGDSAKYGPEEWKWEVGSTDTGERK